MRNLIISSRGRGFRIISFAPLKCIASVSPKNAVNVTTCEATRAVAHDNWGKDKGVWLVLADGNDTSTCHSDVQLAM